MSPAPEWPYGPGQPTPRQRQVRRASDRLREKILRTLAECAFELATKTDPMTDDERRKLDECHRQWCAVEAAFEKERGGP